MTVSASTVLGVRLIQYLLFGPCCAKMSSGLCRQGRLRSACTSAQSDQGLCWGWLEGAKVSCILRYQGIQLILAYSWAMPVILVAGKGRRGMFLFLLFLHFHSCSFFFPVPLIHLHYFLFYLFSPFLWETTQNDPEGLDMSLNPNSADQSCENVFGFMRTGKAQISLHICTV